MVNMLRHQAKSFHRVHVLGCWKKHCQQLACTVQISGFETTTSKTPTPKFRAWFGPCIGAKPLMKPTAVQQTTLVLATKGPSGIGHGILFDCGPEWISIQSRFPREDSSMDADSPKRPQGLPGSCGMGDPPSGFPS